MMSASRAATRPAHRRLIARLKRELIYPMQQEQFYQDMVRRLDEERHRNLRDRDRWP